MTKVALPLLVGILVVDTVLYVVREQVFQLDGRAKPETKFRRLPPGYRSGASMRAETGRVLTAG